MKKEIPFFIQGRGGDDDPTTPARDPIEAPEGIHSLSNATVYTIRPVGYLTDPTNIANGYYDSLPVGSTLAEAQARLNRYDDVSKYYIETTTVVLPSTPRYVSLTQIRVVDLIGEGMIEGLVSGEYSYVGTKDQIGYTSARFVPYPSKDSLGIFVPPWLRSVYWDETPVIGADGKYNFQSVTVDYTAGGRYGSTSIPMTNLYEGGAGITRPINERLRYGVRKVYRILNRNCRAFGVNIRINSLSKVENAGEKLGDISDTEIKYTIYYRPIIENQLPGAFRPAIFPFGEVTVTGKISFGFIRGINIQDPGDMTSNPQFLGWELEITRLTPDSTTVSLRNQTFVDSITEFTFDALVFPNSALISQKFNAEYFSEVPTRAFDARLLKIKIPSNYDPITKQYNGIWDGTFKSDKFWSDNPAWCFYDLLTNKRYGLGKYLDSSYIDKWTLYQIAQYCDTLVPDGAGGIEPRFTCNLLLSSREEAFRVINDMASIFRAIIYYANGSVFSSQDSLKEPVTIFNNSNVEDGNFNYSSSSKRVRHTVAIVRYNDKNNFYKPAVEYVEDSEGIRTLGVREIEITAFGCTSRGQALRLGRWALASERLETETVNFVAGFEGAYLRPGDLFKLSDSNKRNIRFGGRINKFETTSNGFDVTLDDSLTFKNANLYYLNLITPTYHYDTTVVTDLTSNSYSNIRNIQTQRCTFVGSDATAVSGKTKIALPSNSLNTTEYLVSNFRNAVWAIETSGTGVFADPNFVDTIKTYRTINIEEKEPHKYVVSALEYQSSKFNYIESGIILDYQAGQPTTPSPVIALKTIVNYSPKTFQSSSSSSSS